MNKDQQVIEPMTKAEEAKVKLLKAATDYARAVEAKAEHEKVKRRI
jgi:hypothetical protein